MAALFFIISTLSALIYFGIIRRMNEKWLEIFHFISMYLLLLAPIIIFLFLITHGMNTDHYLNNTEYENFNKDLRTKIAILISNYIIPVLLYVPGSFVVSYLLYPFKIIKRNKVLIWVLSIISILITGVVTLFEIAHAFSNM
jgi:hypothetical protein